MAKWIRFEQGGKTGFGTLAPALCAARKCFVSNLFDANASLHFGYAHLAIIDGALVSANGFVTTADGAIDDFGPAVLLPDVPATAGGFACACTDTFFTDVTLSGLACNLVPGGCDELAVVGCDAFVALTGSFVRFAASHGEAFNGVLDACGGCTRVSAFTGGGTTD